MVKKYQKADKAGTAERMKCSLFVPEGDSAAVPINNIIASKTSGLGFKYNGMYNHN